jgi:hypothetical protein
MTSDGKIPLSIALPILGALACFLLCLLIYVIRPFNDQAKPTVAPPPTADARPSPTPEVSESILLSALVDEGCAEVTYYWGPDSRVFRPNKGTVCAGRNFHVGDKDVPYEIRTATIAVDCWGTFCICLIQINGQTEGPENGDDRAICTWDK